MKEPPVGYTPLLCKKCGNNVMDQFRMPAGHIYCRRCREVVLHNKEFYDTILWHGTLYTKKKEK